MHDTDAPAREEASQEKESLMTMLVRVIKDSPGEIMDSRGEWFVSGAVLLSLMIVGLSLMDGSQMGGWLAFCPVASMVTLLVVTTMPRIPMDGGPGSESAQERTRNVASIVVCCVAGLIELLIYDGISRAPGMDELVGSRYADLPAPILDAAHRVLAQMPEASLIHIQATIGLVVSLALFAGAMQLARFLGVGRAWNLLAASIFAWSGLLCAGTSYSSRDYPSACAIAQQAYEKSATLGSDDIAAIAHLGCRVTSAYVATATAPVTIAAYPKPK